MDIYSGLVNVPNLYPDNICQMYYIENIKISFCYNI